MSKLSTLYILFLSLSDADPCLPNPCLNKGICHLHEANLIGDLDGGHDFEVRGEIQKVVLVKAYIISVKKTVTFK